MLFPVIVLPREAGPPASHMLPLPGREPPQWLAVVIALALVAVGSVFLLFMVASTLPNADSEQVVGLLIMSGGIGFLVLLVSGGFYYAFHRAYYQRTAGLREAAERLGLRFDPRVSGAELHDYLGQPVMAFAQGWKIAACNGLEDDAGDVGVRLIDLSYQGNVGHLYQRVTQTVAVLPAVARGLRFSFGPYPSSRDEVYPQWAYDQGFTARLDLDSGRNSCVLYARGRADLAEVVPAALCAELADLADWCIECDGKSLFVFRPGHVVPPERVGEYLDRVRDIDAVAAKLAVLVDAEKAPPAPRRPAVKETTDAYVADNAYAAETDELTTAPNRPRYQPAEPEARRDDAAASVARRMAAEDLDFKFAGQFEMQTPLPGREPALWMCLGPLAGGVALLIMLGLSLARPGVRDADKEEAPFIMGGIFLLGAAGSAVLYGFRARWVWRTSALERACASSGFHLRRTSPPFFAALEKLPLFRFADQGKRSVASRLLDGELEGLTVRVLDVGFQMSCTAPNGGAAWYRAVQTVAVVVDPSVGGRFHAGPLAIPWDWLQFSWPREQGLLVEREVRDADGKPAAVVRTSSDAAAAGALPPRVLQQLTAPDAPVIEGCPGLLMIYRLGRLVPADEMPAFLDEVRRVLRARA